MIHAGRRTMRVQILKPSTRMWERLRLLIPRVGSARSHLNPERFMSRFFRGFSILFVATLGCQQNATTTQSNSPSSQTSTTSTSTVPAPAAPGTRTTASGLQIQDLQVGTGLEAVKGKRVSIHYTGTLVDGTKFDSSLDRGTPYELTLGAAEVIAGWDEGIVGMKIGGKRRLTIPPRLGYGERGYPGAIPPNATLMFDLELMDVK